MVPPVSYLSVAPASPSRSAARAEDSGAHSGFVDAQGRGDFSRGHFFDCRQDQRLAEFCRKRRDQLLKGRADLSGLHGLVGWNFGRRYFGDRLRGIVQGYFPPPSPFFAAIDRDAPGDSREPGLGIFHFRQLRAVAQYSHERFLGGVFGIVVAAQDRIRDAVNQPGMLPDQPFEHVVVTALNGSRSAQNRLSRHHASALTHEDRPGARFVQEFLEGERRYRSCLQFLRTLCHSERSEESAVLLATPSRFLASLGMTT